MAYFILWCVVTVAAMNDCGTMNVAREICL